VLHFKARRKSPMLAPELTASQRRMMRYFVDAALATRRKIAGDLDRLADRIAHDPAQTVANSVPMDPWFDAQEFMQDELLAEVLDAGSRVRIPVVRKAMFGFDRDRPEAALWAAREAGALITEVTNGQVSLVRDLVSSAQQGERTARQVAREVRDSIGLTSDQAGWVSNRWGREFQARISDGMSLAAAEAAADKAAGLYYERVLRYRSETIARTEILRAAHEGRREAWSQGVDGGWINPGAQKQWMTVDDPCPECAAMDGETVPISGEFSVGEPPLHPNCRCDVLLVDEIPEDIQALTDEELDAQIEALLNEPAEIQADSSYEDIVDNAGDLVARGEAMFNDPEFDGRSDPLLSEIYKANGFDVLPQVVPGAEINRLAGLGQPILYRGIGAGTSQEALSYLDQFRSGDYFAGLGTYGNGTYVSTSARTAMTYSRNNPDLVMRMVLAPGARVINGEDLLKEFTAAHGMNGGLQGDGKKLLLDPGRYAAARGYDAIKIPKASVAGDDYYVILNRGKVIVDAENGVGGA
jgi:hypothetical protein